MQSTSSTTEVAPPEKAAKTVDVVISPALDTDPLQKLLIMDLKDFYIIFVHRAKSTAKVFLNKFLYKPVFIFYFHIKFTVFIFNGVKRNHLSG